MNEGVPKLVRDQAYESYHALRWVVEDVAWTPHGNIEERIRTLAAK